MKDAFKITGIFIIGLFTAVMIYPVLHEAGHSLTALTVGARIVDFNIFPLPSVMCDVIGVEDVGIAAIGLGGIFLPYTVSFVLNPRSFWGWYSNFIVRCISLLALCISIICIILRANGKYMQKEDVIQVFNVFESGSVLLFAVFAIMLIYGVIKIITDKPLRRVSAYFELN